MPLGKIEREDRISFFFFLLLLFFNQKSEQQVASLGTKLE